MNLRKGVENIKMKSIPEYHPYTKPYNTLPGLYKFGHDFGNGYHDKKVFQKDLNYQKYIDEKLKITHIPINSDYSYSQEINTVLDFVYEKTYYAKWYGYPIQDDFLICLVENGSDSIIYTDVSFPSFWNPEEVLGKSLLQLHEPVPKISLPQKTLAACTKNNFVRFVWSLLGEEKLNQHPSIKIKDFAQTKKLFLQVERQVIVPFKEISCFLFVIKKYIYQSEIKWSYLHETIKNMSPEYKYYKRITKEIEEYVYEISRFNRL